MTSREDYIRQVKARTDAADLAYSLLEGGKGKRFFCPSCQPDRGKTPDLTVKADGFICFKCGKSGDAIELVRLATGRDFNDALDFLANRAGMAPYKRQAGERRAPLPVLAVKKESRPRDVLRPSGAYSDLYAAFLGRVCNELAGTVGERYLASRGIDARTAADYGVRVCLDLSPLWDLADRATLKAAGLASFYVFQKAGLPFLVFPYIRDGLPVYLKGRCLLDKAEADAREIPRFLNTAAKVPCLWNHDAIAAALQVLICEGEIDALTGILAGYTAVGLPGWSHFKDAWTFDFKDKDVLLVLDADAAGDQGAKDIARKFMQAGLSVPRQIMLQAGKDLNDVFQEFMKAGKTERGEGGTHDLSYDLE